MNKKKDMNVEDFLESKRKSVKEMITGNSERSSKKRKQVQFGDGPDNNMEEDDYFKEVLESKRKAKKQKAEGVQSRNFK
jgi:hypothetical protein